MRENIMSSISRHTIAECRELRNTLHELADKGQINRFLKKGPRFLQKEHEPARPEPRDEECSMEIVATIAGGYVEGITRRITVPTMVSGGGEGPCFTSPHNYPLVVEMKMASAIVWRILIDTGSSIDTITWDCLWKLKYPGRETVPLVHPILGFGGQDKQYKHNSQKGRQKEENQNPRGPRYKGLHHGHCPWPRPSSSPLWLGFKASPSRGIVSSSSRPPSTVAATCSSSIVDGSVESAGTSNHDLASFSIKASLAEASATKKSTAGARVCTEGSPAASGEDPPIALRPTDHRRSLPLFRG
ncbi:hypothetical protein Cgig2_005825 [Carnegiea gigantea]|uniref:Uncharacterized protein n=1 Tax=Carnegiea gigantea TaxID=171969 RepID=A0A9Q1QLM8_9CARY|nr:hypothetical protein Cgig2_005825 [Carnegiea gigantea]